MPPSYNTPSSSQHQYHNLPIAHVGAGRSHSPGPSSFSYHNPTLAASPYSTLPRRLRQQQQQHPPSSSSSSPAPTATSTFKSGATQLKITAKTPLLEDDRESCV